ncbi:TetR/AcrR family transcriptional regulator [Streptomyces sp. NBC_01363]|uniref:TetR/AcrR family transcriptional regulator n=1 Tax=Streptomyces sp. NBC_01363 TaxID=2903840 RepID=UPI002251DAAD|nr:TetR/AcrR family transcriptional regulator [Streptomyces sp. NBC_01363]MCX4736730.1 TetR/AcrR family transcriptional regulator [Streptomyces sp. NBC_01363]
MQSANEERAGDGRPVRADARISRERIVAAAGQLFAEEGVSVSLERIAQHAGVGSATLHRHFQGRRALAVAVMDERVRALCARARRLSTECEPGQALEAWVRAVVEHNSTFRGLAALLCEDLAEPGQHVEARHDEVRAAGGELLHRAQQAGEARHDITISDLLNLANGIAVATERVRDRERQADHLLDVVITGVRPRAYMAARDAHTQDRLDSPSKTRRASASPGDGQGQEGGRGPGSP